MWRLTLALSGARRFELFLSFRVNLECYGKPFVANCLGFQNLRDACTAGLLSSKLGSMIWGSSAWPTARKNLEKAYSMVERQRLGPLTPRPG